MFDKFKLKFMNSLGRNLKDVLTKKWSRFSEIFISATFTAVLFLSGALHDVYIYFNLEEAYAKKYDIMEQTKLFKETQDEMGSNMETAIDQGF